MLIIALWITAAISWTSSLITIITFINPKIGARFRLQGLTNRTGWLLACLVFSCVLVGFIWWQERQDGNSRLLQQKRQRLVEDARQVADSIIVSGWEEAGEYLGYLSLIAGFYDRHKERFASEADDTQQELSAWRGELRTARSGGGGLHSYEYEDLMGNVRSYSKHLRQIAENG